MKAFAAIGTLVLLVAMSIVALVAVRGWHASATDLNRSIAHGDSLEVRLHAAEKDLATAIAKYETANARVSFTPPIHVSTVAPTTLPARNAPTVTATGAAPQSVGDTASRMPMVPVFIDGDTTAYPVPKPLGDAYQACSEVVIDCKAYRALAESTIAAKDTAVKKARAAVTTAHWSGLKTGAAIGAGLMAIIALLRH